MVDLGWPHSNLCLADRWPRHLSSPSCGLSSSVQLAQAYSHSSLGLPRSARGQGSELSRPLLEALLLELRWLKQSHGQARFKEWPERPCLRTGRRCCRSPLQRGRHRRVGSGVCDHFGSTPPGFPAHLLSYLPSSFRGSGRKERQSLLLSSARPSVGTYLTPTHLGLTHPIHTRSCLARSEGRHPAGVVLPGRWQSGGPRRNLEGCISLGSPPRAQYWPPAPKAATPDPVSAAELMGLGHCCPQDIHKDWSQPPDLE